MKRRATDSAVPAGPGSRITAVRTEHGLSRSQLARASGLRRQDIAAFEEGTAVPTTSDFGAIAVACGVGATDLVRPRIDPAFDALLREYISMVLELRQASTIPPVSLRQEDLTELAKALGGTPELIEARLIELLGTDAAGASEMREAMLPSLTT
jgi:transcriptional regulator with XRE-family HTH domain